ncbi:hypothetical protein [Neolewinella litorea]|uniref:Lipocalin-like domain-containing protein n=1 Tax=Neolewinella litorea TaxID=2562452 RepID=A0A4V3XKD4_9BACT|nr:hypothetical protein [Neolewinella litorea]THH36533.1 hypothetical protein E4021_14800 [Neolewinella litorea]
MIKYALILVCSLLIFACGPVSDAVEEAGVDPESVTDTSGDLQGVWRSEDDSLSTVRFEGNLMIFGYEGEPDATPENFVVGRSCPDVSDAVAPTGEGNYLAVPDDGRCYFITKLTEDKLHMSLVGKGNTVRYVKIAGGITPE